MPVITLTTDFGRTDGFVGIMKGVILRIAPSVSIVDITHDIEAQDVVEGTYQLKAAYRFFPKDTIHLVVVDPGVGSERVILACRSGGYVFVAPDNGILTTVIEEQGIDRAVRVENPEFFLKPISHTFHGRDIFAPVAAHIAKGVALTDLGSPLAPQKIKRLHLAKAMVTDKAFCHGEIISIDRFGNLITNIHRDEIKRLFDLTGSNKKLQVAVRIGEIEIADLAPSYQSAGVNRPLAIIGSWDRLEIAVNGGDAKAYFGARKGDPVQVHLV